jgi:ferredoxin
LSSGSEIFHILVMSVHIRFLPDDVVVAAEVGEPLLQVAARAGISIPTGCLMGSCHACEVELEDGTAICSCITSVPAGQPELTINLFVDPSW